MLSKETEVEDEARTLGFVGLFEKKTVVQFGWCDLKRIVAIVDQAGS